MNVESRSDMKVRGRPCNLNMCFRKSWAMCVAVYGWEMSVKWLYLVSRSMTTHKLLYPYDVGRPSMKSMVMLDHG